MTLLLLLGAAPTYASSLTEDGGRTDVGQGITLSGSTTEDTGRTDDVTTSLTSATNYTESPADALGLTDAGQGITLAGSTTESRGSTDTVTPTLTTVTAFTQFPDDSRGATDVGKSITRSGSLTEGRGARDTVTTSLLGPATIGQSPTDDRGSTDSLTVDRDQTVSLVDDRGATEDPTDGAVEVTEPLEESAGRTDSVDVYHPIADPGLVDERYSIDTVALARAHNVSDDAGRSDVVSFTLVNETTVNDGRGSTDTVDTVLAPDGPIEIALFPELRGATDAILVNLSGFFTVDLVDARGTSDTVTSSKTVRRVRLHVTNDLLFDDTQRPAPRSTTWPGLWARYNPALTQKGLLLWRDGRVVVVTDWAVDSEEYLDADQAIAGGYVFECSDADWQAEVLRNAGYTLEPVPS